MIKGYKEESGANLRLMTKVRRVKAKKRVMRAALADGSVPGKDDSLEFIHRYFEGPSEEEKDSIRYSILISLLTLLISFYIVWPTFMQNIEIEKKEGLIYEPSAGGSPPPPLVKRQEERVQVTERILPRIYLEIPEITFPKEDEKIELEDDQDWESLDINGQVEGIEFAIGDGGIGPILNAGGDGEIPEPELLFRVEPEYPEPARRARIDGFVLLEAIVSKTGDVINIKVLQAPPARYGFAEKAREAVAKWKFKPSIYKGRPVPVRIRFSVEFNLVY